MRDDNGLEMSFGSAQYGGMILTARMYFPCYVLSIQ